MVSVCYNSKYQLETWSRGSVIKFSVIGHIHSKGGCLDIPTPPGFLEGYRLRQSFQRLGKHFPLFWTLRLFNCLYLFNCLFQVCTCREAEHDLDQRPRALCLQRCCLPEEVHFSFIDGLWPRIVCLSRTHIYYLVDSAMPFSSVHLVF